MYARVREVMQRQGRQIATLDLLITTAALLDEASIVTRNARDFARVPGLAVVGYPPLCLRVANGSRGAHRPTFVNTLPCQREKASNGVAISGRRSRSAASPG